MKECEWCGKTYQNSGHSVGGYDVCSEKCRLETKESIENGDTSKKNGCLPVIFWGAVIIIGYLLMSSSGQKSGSVDEHREVYSSDTNETEGLSELEIEIIENEFHLEDDQGTETITHEDENKRTDISEAEKRELDILEALNNYSDETEETGKYEAADPNKTYNEEKNEIILEKEESLEAKVMRLLDKGYGVGIVAEITGISKKEVRKIRRNHN